MLRETSAKTKQELGKISQYQEIMLQENKAISEQLNEHRLAISVKEQECDEANVTKALQAKEIQALKLQVAEL